MVLNEHTPVQTQPTGTDTGAAAPLDFTTFMRSYQDMVFTTAARVSGSDSQAQDIAQEVFVRAFEHFADLSGSATAGGWLKTVATNLAINHVNRYRKRWRMFSEMHAADGDESAAEIEWEAPDRLLSDLSAEQRGAIVEAALRRLPDQQRLPLVLYHFEELSYQEIAAKLGVSLTKVKTDIRRGRAALLPALQAADARETLES
jgi:RNA polymerase sigma-70 factor (ECF subfamily)